MESKDQQELLLDLRSFYTIGFQNSSNGLWLGKQGYKPESSLLENIINSCIKNQVNISAITSEDDEILPEYPEDRFGFLARKIPLLKEPYSGEQIDNVLIRLKKNGDSIYLFNSETLHNSGCENWGGIKLNILGMNMVRSVMPDFSLVELLDACKSLHLPVLLCNSGISSASLAVSEMHAEKVSAIVSHDANNAFPGFFRYIPSLAPYTKASNRRATALVDKLKDTLCVPGVAVSSSHWMHQTGSAGIYVNSSDLFLENGAKFLSSLERVLSSKKFRKKEGYNSISEVLRLMYLLRKYGSSSDRFKGAFSSYNSIQKNF